MVLEVDSKFVTKKEDFADISHVRSQKIVLEKCATFAEQMSETLR